MLNKYLSLPIRIHFFIFVFLLAVPFLCIIIYVGIMERKDALKDAQNECSTFVNIIAREEQILVTGIRQLATTIAILPEVKTRDRHRIDPLLKKILKDNPQYTNITISDEQGRILESAMPFKDGMSVAQQKYFKDTVRTGMFSSGEYIIGRMTNKPIMIFGYPVKNTDGQLTGVIGIGIDFIDIRHVFEKLNLPAGSSFSLLDHNGTILYRHLQDNLSTNLMGNKDIKKDIFTRMQEGPEEGAFTAEGNDGNGRIFAYKKMTLPHEAQPYLYIRSSIPQSSAIDKASQRLFVALSVISLFSFAGLFLAWFIGKRIIVDRITALENASKKLATGTQVTKVSQIVKGGDLGELAKTIDLMMETIAEKEVILRTVLEAVNDSLFMIDHNGTVLALNTTTAERFRKGPEEILGKNIYDLMPAQLARARRSHQEEAIQSGKVVRFEDEREGRWIESTLYPVEKDLPNRIVIHGRDITERKRAEESLRESESQFRNYVENAPIGVFVCDEKGRYLQVNPAATNITGYTCEELLTMSIPDLLPPESQVLAARYFQVVVETGRVSAEFAFRHKHGKIGMWSLEGVLLSPTRFMGLVTDITERKEAEKEKAKLQDQLLQSQKMESVGRLAGGVAHDFNNMLGVILGHAEMAMEEVDPAQPLHADLEEIRRAAARSTELTRQLLAFARKQTFSPKVLDLNETVEGMLKMLRRLIGEDVNLAWHPGANTWPVRMDPSQIDQILANLSINARDAITGIGKVTIETQNVRFDETHCADHADLLPGEYVQLTVSDNGCGMDNEILGKLFEPFFTTKETGKGTGLGLATVYGIVKQNNGFIDVYSEPGQGTTFKIYLPRYIGKIEKAQMEGQLEPVAPGHKTILVVEDEPSLLELSKFMLEKQGYLVLAAATPGEAIRLAEEYKGEIHLLMTDVVMPEMNGRELAKKILSFYPDIKRLFMSGYTADVIAHHGVLDEEVHFIQKPFSIKSLATKVRKALDQK